MKSGREIKAIPSADLLVCFPSRSHLPLMPNPVYSPGRGSDRRRHHRQRRRKSAESPMTKTLWTKGKSAAEISEPSSPKVTCAGQIKMRPKSRKGWESVMEEIERIQNRRKMRFNWMESLGFKKDVMQLLKCLGRIRFDFRCFRAFPEPDLSTEDEDEDEEEEEDGNERSRSEFCNAIDDDDGPPKNALILMRCRSAPAKSWIEIEEETETEEEVKKVKKSLKWLMEEENRHRFVPDFFSRSRSSKV